METRVRSTVKAVLWTLIGLISMSVIGLLFTGSLSQGGLMAVVNAALGFISYLVYERVWSKVRWGRL